ncbi:MAG: Nif3-like dinuclear metal center hexameric protein, partial [Planctomycetota bacterium]
GNANQSIQKVAIACGSAGSFLATANRHGCDLFITGETTFHTCLEAEATGIGLLLVGHYASERFACENLAERLAAEFADATVWASENEHDPLQLV